MRASTRGAASAAASAPAPAPAPGDDPHRSATTVRLTAAEIPGAELPPLHEWNDKKPNLNALKIFALTRGWCGASGQTVAELRNRARTHLELEKVRSRRARRAPPPRDLRRF